MDFEDEFDIQNDAYDDDYDLYSGGDDADASMDCVEEADDSNDHMISHRHEQNYTILTEADIHQRQEDEITRTSTVLSISKVAATILLRHYNWNDVSKVHDEWFADEEKVRRVVGLMEKKPPNNNRQVVTCGICFEAYDRRMHTSAANCGHPFCNTCWTCYISTAIHDGPGCLMLRCPEPSCAAAVGHDMIRSLASAEDMERYSSYLIRSYVEHSRKIKWCPAPGCEHAVDFVIGSSGRNYDVTCRCSYSFCWNCTEDAHRPVDCGTVAKWTLKNSSESENTTWILAKTKPCPKCKRPIEKNQGCMHMSCGAPCGFQFCWLCLGAWSDHNLITGDGYFSCNRYETQRKEGLYDEEDKRREMAEKSLEKYTHYYERWATNQSSWQKAMADLEKMQTVNLEKLSGIHGVPVIWLEFITEAWLQIIECRRVLKWTYAYGYYLPEHEDAKRQLFEYLQGQAESWLERLHQCAEKELQGYLDAERSSQEFDEFRSKLAGLTGVTRNYFENLVLALENGLSDVNSSSKNLGSTSSKWRLWRFGRGSRNINDWDQYWSCEHCTFANVKTAEICQMCYQLR